MKQKHILNMITHLALGDANKFTHKDVTYTISDVSFNSTTGELETVKISPEHPLARTVLAHHIKRYNGMNTEAFYRELSDEIKRTEDELQNQKTAGTE